MKIKILECQWIDTDLGSKTYEYTREGVTSVNEMKHLLKTTLKNNVFKNVRLPNSSNKRFFPRNSKIQNHRIHALRSIVAR